jgi:hydroxymethylglutaryl-CoA lyase
MSLPTKVKIVEVGPRDGFQSLKEWIPTELKLKVINSLFEANVSEMEITSFVHPKAIPQMKDAKEVVQAIIDKYPERKMIALVPNLFGAKTSWDTGIQHVTYVISASEKHNMENVRRTIEESFIELRSLKEQIPQLKIKLDVATAFGCPFLGDIPIEQVYRMVDEGLAIGVDEICLCDTIGIANPKQVSDMLQKIKEKYPKQEFGLHLHDTRGMGMANVLVALQQGFTVFESAIGGLGGCPFAPGAAGNIATEDLVNMFDQMGIKTNVQIEKLLETARLIKAQILPNLTGHMVNVCTQ